MRNLQHFGYGVKGFVLSMIETAIELTDGRLESGDVRAIIGFGHEMLAAPVTLLEGVRDAIEELAASFPLILITKGDLLTRKRSSPARASVNTSPASRSSRRRTPTCTAA